MKKPTLIFLLTCSLICYTSCSPQKTEKQETGQVEQAADEVRCMPTYAYSDSLTQGSHKIVYSITSEPDTTLKVIVDEDGMKYAESRWTLSIKKDGQALFDRSFTKADFKSQLPEDFQKLGIMDGMRFHHAMEGKLYFNTCVSYPESDMSCPFLLTIGPDGSYTIAPDNSEPEADELPPTQQEDGV